MKIIKKILTVLLLVYFVLCLLLFFYQDSLIFKNDITKKVELLPFIDNIDYIDIKVEKDVHLYGKYKKVRFNKNPLILYFGGHSSDITSFFNHTSTINTYEMIAFNYRGYVNSQGKPSETNLFNDALKIYDKYARNKEIIVVGKSLGTGVATYLATKRKVKALILITPYDSILSIAKNSYALFPIDILLKHKFESSKYIKNLTMPVVLMQVENDKVIKSFHFNNLKNNVQNLSSHILFKNISHSSIFSHKDFQNLFFNSLEEIK